MNRPQTAGAVGAGDHTRLTATLADGTVLGYAEFGDPAGRPLLFFHGWPGSRLQARILDGPARRYGLRVLAPDRPGIGLSTPAPFASVAAWIDVLSEWIEKLNLAPFNVLGVSGGGPYSLASAVRMPQRVIAAGVCCGVPPPAILDKRRDLFWVYRLLRSIDRRTPHLVAALMVLTRFYLRMLPPRWSLQPFSFLLPRVDRRALQYRTHMDTIAVSTREAFAGSAEAVIADARRLQQPWGFEPAEVATPVHFWHGRKDRNIPITLIQPLFHGLPQAQVHFYPHDGHYSLPLCRAAEILDHLTSDHPESE